MAPGYGNHWWGPIHFPSITPESDDIEGLFKGLHEWLTTALAVVAIGQALAALRHCFWLKDDVLRRMLPLWQKD